MNPTALIPFCEFGGNISAMGVKIGQLETPVCNSFRAKIIKNQLCFEVDPNKYKDKIDLKSDLSLSFFIHYNEDREDTNIDIEVVVRSIFQYVSNILIGISEEHFITVNTIGNVLILTIFEIIVFLKNH